MKKIILLSTLVLSACGYNSVYQKTSGFMHQVSVGEVVVAQNKKLPGERRIAQLIHRQLSQVFNANSQDTLYTLNIHLEEDRRTLAVLRDATEDRFEVTVEADIELLDDNGKVVFTKNIYSSAPYNVESSPYSTEAGKDRARQSAAETLSTEVLQYINFFLHDQK